MSRAFVKESDEELAAGDLPERPLPLHPNYVTPQGLEQLQARVRELQEQHEQLARIALKAAEQVRAFGLPPKVAFVSHSNYGSSNRESARRAREAYEIFRRMAPDVECDGEMHGDAAILEAIRRENLMDSSLHGEANILVCPNIDAANILFNVLKAVSSGASTMGPILMGAAAPAHVMTPSSTLRRVLAMMALVAAQAGQKGTVARLRERNAG
jgi:malate dehydrogenase (oxaloacetate-decarboxylating)(NADP+)